MPFLVLSPTKRPSLYSYSNFPNFSSKRTLKAKGAKRKRFYVNEVNGDRGDDCDDADDGDDGGDDGRDDNGNDGGEDSNNYGNYGDDSGNDGGEDGGDYDNYGNDGGEDGGDSGNYGDDGDGHGNYGDDGDGHIDDGDAFSDITDENVGVIIPSDSEEAAHVAVSTYLDEWGYTDYGRSMLGGNKKEAEMKTFRNRIAKFLIWAYPKTGEIDDTTVLWWSRKLVKRNYISVAAYTKYLDEVKHFKPSTIAGHLDTLTNFFQFVCFYSDLSQELSNSFDPIKNVIKKCRFSANKALRKEKGENLINTKISHLQLPSDGLTGLLRIANEKLRWLESIALKLEPQNIDRDIYDCAVSTIIVGHYCRNPQGRPQAFSHITLSQLKEFKDHGYAVSPFLKTRAKFGVQTVLCDPQLLRVNRIYVKRFRPIALQNAINAGIDTSPNFLWLTFDGKQQTRIGRCVTNFFRTHENLHVTVTQIRGLTETTAHKALLKGIISPTQREAIMSVNGHSSRTTKDYYLMSDRKADAAHGRAGFNKMLGFVTPERLSIEDTCDGDAYTEDGGDKDDGDDSTSAMESIDSDSAFGRDAPIVFGAEHPQGDNMECRAKWTSEEIGYAGKWVERKLEISPGITNIIAKCLAHIRATPSCHPIFHPRHVVDSTRLKHGIECYEKQTGKRLIGTCFKGK
jgi:hypothetical protein